MIEFRAWPKTPRLFRDVVITEKIDGTNAAIIVSEHGTVGAQSRSRLISPDRDNFGFAAWVYENAGELMELGPGHHYGEWWGHGIQRGYGCAKGERYFSLFNTKRWTKEKLDAEVGVENLTVVPVLGIHTFGDEYIQLALADLKARGSLAKSGYMNPEGLCVLHTQSQQVYKVLIENDNISKTEAGLIPTQRNLETKEALR